MRKVISRSLCLVLTVFLLSGCLMDNDGIVSKHGKLSVKGTALVNEKGQPVVLHGVSLGWHNWWPRFYNKQTVTWMKQDWKIEVIRAAIAVEPERGYIVNPELGMKCLTNVIDAAIENDIYVIIDWHAHNLLLEEAKAFFTLVAEKYKDCPNIIYELVNEPDDETWEAVKEYSEALIPAIRAIAPDNIILVGCPHWDQDIHLPAQNPIRDYDNLMYVMHYYAGTHKQELRDRATRAIKKGLPVFISECGGMEASGNGNIQYDEWDRWTQWMAENQLSWTAWAVTDKLETCSMIKSENSPIANWKDADLKEWGIVVKKMLTGKR
ncbi:MAG: glycoside hydrolase family 5 protein [Bacteroidales bacterium]|nr:glycoside hydrolase family 5 protein [Bacteroidales bacterium]